MSNEIQLAWALHDYNNGHGEIIAKIDLATRAQWGDMVALHMRLILI